MGFNVSIKIWTFSWTRWDLAMFIATHYGRLGLFRKHLRSGDFPVEFIHMSSLEYLPCARYPLGPRDGAVDETGRTWSFRSRTGPGTRDTGSSSYGKDPAICLLFRQGSFSSWIFISPCQKQVFMSTVKHEHTITLSDALKTWDISANTCEISFLKLAAKLSQQILRNHRPDVVAWSRTCDSCWRIAVVYVDSYWQPHYQSGNFISQFANTYVF